MFKKHLTQLDEDGEVLVLNELNDDEYSKIKEIERH